MIENDSRLYFNPVIINVYMDNLVQASGTIQHDPKTDGLSRKTCCSSTRNNRNPMFEGVPQDRLNVLYSLRDDDGNWSDSINTGGSTVGFPRGIITEDISLDDAFKVFFDG